MQVKNVEKKKSVPLDERHTEKVVHSLLSHNSIPLGYEKKRETLFTKDSFPNGMYKIV